MPTSFTSPTDLVTDAQASHITQFVGPVNNLEKGAALYAAEAGGSVANIYVAAPSPAAPSPLTAGYHLRLKITNANTGASTVNVGSSDGALAIKKKGGIALVSGEMPAGSVSELVFDGTDWELQNPALPVLPSVCDGRLTLTTAVPATTADVTGASTIYFSPFGGNQVALYNGSAWTYHALTERSLALSGLTADKQYDVFLYDNAGTLTLELSAAWTNDTTRADALATQDGVRVKSVAATRRLVGTIRTTAATTTEDSAAKRFVRNEAHPLLRPLKKLETNTSVAGAGDNVWRAYTNNAATRVQWVQGPNQAVHLTGHGYTADNTGGRVVGIGLDSTSANSAESLSGGSGHTGVMNHHPEYRGFPAEGFHYGQMLEATSSALINVLGVTAMVTGINSNAGIFGEVWV